MSGPLSKEAILEGALELHADQRSAYLVRVCAGNGALHLAIEALLRASERAGNFLSAPVVGLAEAGSTEKTPMARDEQPGTLIGRYKLLDKIGEGGFGTVYVAEQRDPVKRRVALKIIKLGMDTKQVVARFEAER